jgi:hypothetical protein
MYVGGVNERQGKTKAQRRILFYGGCLWMRILLAFLVLFISFHGPRVTGLILAVCGAIVAIGNIVPIARFGIDAVWWNRGVHAGFGFLISLTGALLYTGMIPWFIPGLIIIVNIIYGWTHSFIANPFEQ